MLTSRVFSLSVLVVAFLLIGSARAAEKKSVKVAPADAPAAVPVAPAAEAAPAPAAVPAPPAAEAAPAPAAVPTPPAAEDAPAPAVVDTACCPAPNCCCPKDPCIKYWNHRLLLKGHKRCCECQPPTQMILKVKHPCCCGCTVEVPVCVPACLKGEPQVTSCCGPLGRGVVTYTWCDGFKVRVVFQLHGDLLVHTYGL